MGKKRDNEEQLMREVFDIFNKDAESAFLNRFSAASRTKNKITRVTFNNSFKPLMSLFRGKDTDEIYTILNSYFIAFQEGLSEIDCEDTLLSSIVFRAVAGFFPYAASKLKDRYGAEYTVDNFYNTMEGMFSRVKPSRFKKPGNSYKALVDYLESNIKSEFLL